MQCSFAVEPHVRNAESSFKTAPLWMSLKEVGASDVRSASVARSSDSGTRRPFLSCTTSLRDFRFRSASSIIPRIFNAPFAIPLYIDDSGVIEASGEHSLYAAEHDERDEGGSGRRGVESGRGGGCVYVLELVAGAGSECRELRIREDRDELRAEVGQRDDGRGGSSWAFKDVYGHDKGRVWQTVDLADLPICIRARLYFYLPNLQWIRLYV